MLEALRSDGKAVQPPSPATPPINEALADQEKEAQEEGAIKADYAAEEAPSTPAVPPPEREQLAEAASSSNVEETLSGSIEESPAEEESAAPSPGRASCGICTILIPCTDCIISPQTASCGGYGLPRQRRQWPRWSGRLL